MTGVTLDHLSYSTVSNYGQCSEKVRLGKILKVPKIPSWASLGGSAVHKCTEHLDRKDFGIEDEGPPTFDEALDQEIARTVEHSDVPRSEWHCGGRSSARWPDKENEKFWRESGPAWVQTWRSFLKDSPWQIWIDPDGEPAVEIELNWHLGGFPNQGFVDRVLEHVSSGVLLVVDLKSGARTPQSSTQLKVYGHGLNVKYGFIPPYGAYFMNRTSTLTVPVSLAGCTDGSLDHTWSKVKLGIDNDIFIPSPSNMCSSCEVRKYCREWGGEYAAEALPYATSVSL